MKITMLLLLLPGFYFSFSQKISFEKDTIIVQRDSTDITHALKLILKLPADSLYKIKLNDTRLGSLPAIDYRIENVNDTVTIHPRSWQQMFFLVTVKKDTLKFIDRDRTIKFSVALYNDSSRLLTGPGNTDTITIVVKSRYMPLAPLTLPEAGQSASVRFDSIISYGIIDSYKFFSWRHVSHPINSATRLYLDSVTLKFEDKTLKEIQVRASEKPGKEIIFENRYQIPMKGKRNHANLKGSNRYKLIAYRDAENSLIDSNDKKIKHTAKKYIFLGDVLRVIPVLENYTFDYAPADTVIGIGKKDFKNNRLLERAPVVSLFRLRIMNDLLATLGDKPNGVIQAEFDIRLNTNVVDVGNWNFFHSTEIVAKYSQYSKPNRFVKLDTAIKSGELKRYANLMDVIQRPAFYIGFRENVVKYESIRTSTKFNLFALGGIGFTRVSDTVVTKVSDSTVKLVEDKLIKYSYLGAELRIKFMAMKGFFAEVGSHVILPYILTSSINEDISERLEPEEIQPLTEKKFIPEEPKKNKDRAIVAPYITLTIYPEKHAFSSSIHFRAQWFKSITNKNSFLQLQFGTNLNLMNLLNTTKQKVSSKL